MIEASTYGERRIVTPPPATYTCVEPKGPPIVLDTTVDTVYVITTVSR